MQKFLLYIAIFWTVLFFAVVWFVDFDPELQPLIQISDYLMTFHVAGYLVGHGQSAILYPPADTTAFASMPFDKMAHQLLPKMPVSSVAEFMYMPLAAVVFIPLSAAPLNLSLFMWQVISLVCLFVSVQLLWMSGTASSGSGGAGNHVVTTATRMLSSLWFLPSCLSIWIGQVGMAFGMLPLAAGYFVVRNGPPLQPFIAGIIWSLAILKPQFLVPAAVLTFALLVRRRYSVAFGMAAGLLAFAALSILFFTPALNVEWLQCLKVSDIVYSNSKSGIATHIATSLPRTLILLLPVSGQVVFKPVIYGLSAVIFASALFAVWKIRSAKNLSETTTMQLSFLLGIYVTPLVMPHFFFYDYCLFALAAPLVFISNWPAQLNWPIRKLVLITALVVNVYSLIVLAAHQYAVPLLFMLIMLGLYLYLLRICLQDAPGPHPEGQPTIP